MVDWWLVDVTSLLQTESFSAIIDWSWLMIVSKYSTTLLHLSRDSKKLKILLQAWNHFLKGAATAWHLVLLVSRDMTSWSLQMRASTFLLSTCRRWMKERTEVAPLGLQAWQEVGQPTIGKCEPSNHQQGLARLSRTLPDGQPQEVEVEHRHEKYFLYSLFVR